MQHAQYIDTHSLLQGVKGNLLMLAQFVKRPRETGAVVVSSRQLSDGMLRHAGLADAKTVVELGPGIGTMTRDILRRSRPDAQLICLEINERFCSHLAETISDERLTVVNDGAECLERVLDSLGAEKADCVISGLPLRNFSPHARRRVLHAVAASLNRGGTFVLFQYTNDLDECLDAHFSGVSRYFVLRNLPPALVYVCKP